MLAMRANEQQQRKKHRKKHCRETNSKKKMKKEMKILSFASFAICIKHSVVANQCCEKQLTKLSVCVW